MTHLFLIASAMLASTAPANRADILVQTAPQARVGYSDLDLHSVAGRTRLVRRIRSAATSLCSENNIEPLDVRLQQMTCFRVAMAEGLQQMSAISRG
ncbi:MAG TPA: UrcA family protein [Sphingomicrobium sp.]|nr:UrcA family protein [Sphingomicrobium sp.]